MPEQLILDLPVRAALGRDDYFVTDANSGAVATMADWQSWPDGKMILCGPKASGKTHLSHVWAADAQAQVIAAPGLKSDDIVAMVSLNHHIAVENVDAISGNAEAEKALFHLHNITLAEGGKLLFTGSFPPSNWGISLPDLKSRLDGTGLVRLGAPDGDLLTAVFIKLFADRQLEVTLDAVSYLAKHGERSFATAGKLVAKLDVISLAEQRPITRDLARRVLDGIEPEGL
ncbi:MAG: chromosomal replication initiator DnaA [Paracoccaceae bacterium]